MVTLNAIWIEDVPGFSQIKIDIIVEKCLRMVAIYDDIAAVYGRDKENDNANLLNLINVAAKEGLL